jgi:hypothetical protein
MPIKSNLFLNNLLLDIKENEDISLIIYNNYTEGGRLSNKPNIKFLFNKYYKENDFNVVITTYRKYISNSALLSDISLYYYLLSNCEINFINAELLNNEIQSLREILFNNLSYIKHNTHIFLIYKNIVNVNESLYQIIKSFTPDDTRWTDQNYLLHSINNQLVDYNKFLWINNIGFITHDFKIFEYETDNTYTQYLLRNDDTNILKIISRFGLSYHNNSNFIILFNESNDKMIIITSNEFDLLPAKCFILYINENNSIDKTNIFMIDKTNIINKLIFDKIVHFIPKNSIYLMYKYKNTFKIDIIINIYLITAPTYKIYEKMLNKDIYNDKNYYHSFTLAPSLILPISKTFNKEIYKSILKFYYSSYIMNEPIFYNKKLIELYNINSDKLRITNTLETIIEKLKNIIKSKIKINNDSYNSCIKIMDETYHRNFINNYLREYRFCKMNDIVEIDISLSTSILKLD